jgi:3',5'-nucleoside bisphosphate phosphatase
MRLYRADLHIHTVLSPCGDIDMSPVNIVAAAALKGLEIIGITDHNTTRHCALITRLAEERGIFVMHGAEVTTKEEVHCLAFFENTDAVQLFQTYLDENIADIVNVPEIFGYQLQVDENDIVLYEEKKLLTGAISKSFEETELFVHELNGLFIPAHINRSKNSVYSQLGFLPYNMKADALEISGTFSPGEFAKEHPGIIEFPLISNSDAHFINDVGKRSTTFFLKEPSFNEIRLALKNKWGRKIISE